MSLTVAMLLMLVACVIGGVAGYKDGVRIERARWLKRLPPEK